MAVSFIIPSFNGQQLLTKHLPSVLASLAKNDELIIVDDASTDQTLDFLKKKFQLKKSNLPNNFLKKFNDDGQLFTAKLTNGAKIQLLINNKNLRFASSVNRAVYLASNDYLFLLNNDVAISKQAKELLLEQFKQKSVFAVSCLEYEVNEAKNQAKNQLAGKNLLWFEKGMFFHSKAKDFKTGNTAWACGGSAMFDRKKWLQLAGFDLRYYPAYWEDIDLSFRAKKRGWQVLFLEKAVAYHCHESTNASVFGQEKIAQISWRNAQKFVWQHGDFWQKLANLLWQPYWLWQRHLKKFFLSSQTSKTAQVSTLAKFFLKNEFFLLVIIISLASFLRFYQLGKVPHGMAWDEAAIGYNGYAIFTTRRDEWLNRLPVSFKSFGDFKAPLAIYLNGIFTYLFGMNLWAVRLPFALAGVVSVLLIYLLAKNLAKIYQISNQSSFALISAFLLALSPWHLHFSRAGFESGLALMFVLLMLVFLSKFILFNKDKSSPLEQSFCLFLAGLAFNASIYTYHSSKIVAPLLLLLVFLAHWPTFKQKILLLLAPIFLNLLVLYPFLKDSLQGEGLTRAGSLTIFAQVPIWQKISLFFSQLLVHFSPQFLIFGLTDNLRHGNGKWGVLLISTFLLIILAVFYFHKKKLNKFLFFGLIFWAIIGVLPASLAEPTPHANRALLALPAFLLLASLAFSQLNQKAKIAFVCLHLAFFAVYWRYYYLNFAKNSADDYKDGYLASMQIAFDYEKGTNDRPEVEKIIFTNYYGQPYIYALFVRKTNPIWYQGGSLIKYEFKDKVDIGDLSRKNTLVVASNRDDLPIERANHLVYGSDGQVRFKLYYVK